MILNMLLIGFLFVCLVLFSIKLYIALRKLISKKKNKELNVGFFHPYCNAGGGGERVLWSAVRAIQKQYKDAHCVIYSGDPVPAIDIIKNVEVRFNIKLLRNVDIIYLKSRFLVEAKYYPIFTLLMQSLGSVVLGLEALLKYVPDIYIDTMGYAWTFPIFKFLGSCPVGAYVHFPTISTDMLKNVQNRMTAVNNRKYISNNKILSLCKLIYYQIFASWYGLVGRQANLIMVNSSWTRNHILELWKKPQFTFTVYPPCDVPEFNRIPLEIHDGKTRIVSIAQFRPEKNHELQIRAFYKFLESLDNHTNPPILVLIGSCRHEEDYQRIEVLRILCCELKISEKVEFKVNLSFQEVIQEMKNSTIALHTMKDEHFGIGIVECMSAGLVMIAHNSGGPKMDIVVDYNGKKTGFLADDIDSFADAMEDVWKMGKKDLHKIRTNARASVSRFSADKFEDVFLSAFRLLTI
ncbi:GDP-Man:Man(3)GlcNAc(2)-PP-Dol alpha-1,2-mannosyltransferase-like [Argiope bruennichi]|uniref:GDP-Man:Man(3)GlcNAc(2)-PP-Dol alpha-1,2-mannosyltransferase n=1 Tax=Argiope bruennichi TaxID=94029 RepID=A0A8T0E4T4_ARGBR|nr:GDP-Man:Man(3)GlcNAc(2)-PP-Dol alpha-1,2-mannosyltransferase-like [Argiope bruennichi]KAF8766849.1 GDP-Man:Man(3)GlcNAc(2)-PP-Dol like protein [Argiope bruennichi]